MLQGRTTTTRTGRLIGALLFSLAAGTAVAEMPSVSQAIIHSQEICKAQSTARDRRDERMYDQCLQKKAEGFREYAQLRRTAAYEWFPAVEQRVIGKWTKNGNTDWAMVASGLKKELDAYRDVEQAVRSGQFESAQARSCNRRWADSDSVWSMTLHCLKNG